jgi:hypothetical protein
LRKLRKKTPSIANAHAQRFEKNSSSNSLATENITVLFTGKLYTAVTLGHEWPEAPALDYESIFVMIGVPTATTRSHGRGSSGTGGTPGDAAVAGVGIEN